jgi:hypothetical protein
MGRFCNEQRCDEHQFGVFSRRFQPRATRRGRPHLICCDLEGQICAGGNVSPFVPGALWLPTIAK